MKLQENKSQIRMMFFLVFLRFVDSNQSEIVFKVFDEISKLNWFEARDFCVDYGAVLATFDDALQYQAVKG